MVRRSEWNASGVDSEPHSCNGCVLEPIPPKGRDGIEQMKFWADFCPSDEVEISAYYDLMTTAILGDRLQADRRSLQLALEEFFDRFAEKRANMAAS